MNDGRVLVNATQAKMGAIALREKGDREKQKARNRAYTGDQFKETRASYRRNAQVFYDAAHDLELAVRYA